MRPSWSRPFLFHLAVLFTAIVLFQIGRIMLLLCALHEFAHLSPAEWLPAFQFSIPQDISAAAYVATVMHVIWLLGVIRPDLSLRQAVRIIWLVFIFILAILYGIEAVIMPEWHMKITTHLIVTGLTLDYAIAVMGNDMIIRAALMFITMAATGWVIGNAIVLRFVPPRGNGLISKGMFLSWGIILPLLLLELRASISIIPVTSSSSVYSEYPQCNQLATNSAWYLADDLLHWFHSQDTAAFMRMDLADSLVQEVYCPKPNPLAVSGHGMRPSIVIIVLESWAAACCGSLHEQAYWTPSFDRIASEGYLFRQMYATGWTSDVGLAAMFSGYPGMVKNTFVENVSPGQCVPSIFRLLAGNGYVSSFLFGGDLDYAGLRGYLRNAGVNVIRERRDLSGLETDRLGVADGPLFSYALDYIRNQHQQHITTIFTQSTHAPYTFPGQESSAGLSEGEAYLAAMQYSDSCLGDFMDSMRNDPAWDSTLVLLVADHSHDTPWNDHLAGAERNRIPCLLTGGALPDSLRGHCSSTICSQTDIPMMLTGILGIQSPEFPFSRNPWLKECPGLAYYTYFQGIAMVSDSGSVAYDLNRRSILYADPMSARLRWQQMMLAKAMLQTALQRLRSFQGC